MRIIKNIILFPFYIVAIICEAVAFHREAIELAQLGFRIAGVKILKEDIRSDTCEIKFVYLETETIRKVAEKQTLDEFITLAEKGTLGKK
jgi:hypothetical protein